MADKTKPYYEKERRNWEHQKEIAKEDMCDNYCKYSNQINEYNNGWDVPFPDCCVNCPLDIL